MQQKSNQSSFQNSQFSEFSEKLYAVDKIIEKAGHVVLRLPLYHFIFNATELAWDQVEHARDQNVYTEQSDKVMALSENWTNFTLHVQNEEQYQKRNILDDRISMSFSHSCRLRNR